MIDHIALPDAWRDRAAVAACWKEHIGSPRLSDHAAVVVAIASEPLSLYNHRMAASDLYDTDFYLWTQSQAEALRAAGKGKRGSNEVEWDRLAEEVEDLGKNDVHAAESLTTQILIHLFKLAWTQREEPKGHWESEVVTLRGNLRRKLTPTIRNKVAAELEALHAEAAEAASRAFKSEEPSAEVDVSKRWTFAQILGDENDPIG